VVEYCNIKANFNKKVVVSLLHSTLTPNGPAVSVSKRYPAKPSGHESWCFSLNVNPGGEPGMACVFAVQVQFKFHSGAIALCPLKRSESGVQA
jgi:hypothetical protein